MKICFISAGTFDHIQPYIDYFKSNGNEVTFIALSPSPDRNVNTIDAWRGDRKTYNIKTQKWKYFISAFKARNIVKKIKPDIVHAHYATSGGLAALMINHPNTILTVHGSDVNISVKSVLWKILLKRIFAACKFINVVSKDLYRQVVLLNVAEQKVSTINLGIDYQKYYFNREGIHDFGQPLKLICNRSFKPVYDHMTLLKAMVVLKQRGIAASLTLLGDGPLKEELQQFVKYNDLEKEVFFLGMVNNDSQVEIFKQHNVYISSSLSDGTSLGLLEAMASGMLPIVSDIAANRDWIKSDTTGLLFPVGNHFVLADYIIKISENTLVIPNYANANQALVELEGNRPKNMERVESLYNQMKEMNIKQL